MRAAGIVAEFNPFHNGHALLIERAREALGGDAAVVCAMSGDFVQRGEAAVWSKFARAEAAARCGADLVFELPLPWALSSAEGFARGGVGPVSYTHLDVYKRQVYRSRGCCPPGWRRSRGGWRRLSRSPRPPRG